MQTQDDSQLDEEVTITLPVNAVDSLMVPLGNQVGGNHGVVENGGSRDAAAVGRGGLFPCFKKSVWGDRIRVTIVQGHGVLDAA